VDTSNVGYALYRFMLDDVFHSDLKKNSLEAPFALLFSAVAVINK